MEIKRNFLKASYNSNWDIYEKSLKNAGSVKNWDIFIVTASNEEQAKAYELQIKYRKETSKLSEKTKFIVIPDPKGKRVGSGGATLNALHEAYKIIKAENDSNNAKNKMSFKESEFNHNDNRINYLENKTNENPFLNKKILIIHSGGDSKRIPQYSAFGKLFSKVPRELPDGRYSTLFDEFVISLSGIPSRMKDGLVVASGDVLLLFNHNQLDLGRQGAVGISIKTPAEKGINHGVFLSKDGSLVEEFLHKQSIEILKDKGAINENNLVNIDTGLIWMDSNIVNKLFQLMVTDKIFDYEKYHTLVNDKIRLNFYGDFIIPLTKNANLESYLKEESEGVLGEELVEVRKRIWSALHKEVLHVQALCPAEFIHFGTTKELSNLMAQIDNEYSYLSWKRKVVSFHDRYKPNAEYIVKDNINEGTNEDISIINSYIGAKVKVHDRCFLEDCLINSNSILGYGSILSNIETSNYDINLKDNLVLHSLPVTTFNGLNGYVTRIYGILDNAKLAITNSKSANEDKSTFLNNSLREYVEKLNINENLIWESEYKDLWNAKFYVFHEDKDKSLEYALMLQDISKLSQDKINEIFSMERYSLKESYEISNTTKILDYQNRVEDYLRAHDFVNRVKDGAWVESVKKILTNNNHKIKSRLDIILEIISGNKENRLFKVKIYRVLAEILKEYPSVELGEFNNIKWYELEDMAYNELKIAIEENAIPFEDSKAEKFKDTAIVESPARVNFGGGWSDTPPYSMENGGTILNAAISLNGKMPIRAKASIIKEKVVRLISEDLSISVDIFDARELLNYSNTSDPAALHKAALLVTGITHENLKSLDEIYEKLGGGLELTTSVDIPNGSGLGTSSILAGTVIKALSLLQNKSFTENALFDSVLRLEQLLTTGGGWQDQVGGLVPGIKIVTSGKGLPQIIEYSNLKLREETLKELNERFVIVFTGQRRLAKGILREIMGEYIINNPETLDCLTTIQRLAVMMKFELEKGNINAFAELLNEHWVVNQKLDKGCTNTYINQIIDVCKPYVCGVMICGAGGGGFLQMVLKDKCMKKEMSDKLKEVFMDNKVAIFESKFV